MSIWGNDKDAHKEAYGHGVRDAENADLVDDFIHGLGDVITTVVPGETSENRSYESGYHDQQQGRVK